MKAIVVTDQAAGTAGAVGAMVAQLAHLTGAYVIGTGRAADRQLVSIVGPSEERPSDG